MSDSSEDPSGSSSATHELDGPSSRIRIHTRATGLLARFAHDLEIEVPAPEGEVTVDGESWSATLRLSAARLRVVGVLRKGQVDEGVLSASDKDEIRQRMDEQVFPRASTVVVRAEGEQTGRGSAKVELGKGHQKVSLRHAVEQRDDGSTRVEGRLELSLRALGVKEIKGPLGAFKVHDGVDVLYSCVVRPIARGA
ncbi:MAG: hypothetical protein JRI23_13275 [Deltaproteobacteria bacterium]|jgi:hypothetical protein|nr:hypothetical protein [Deltaproteobacteria bacterium]MBW2532695.1 hypothetical protein [Deltaproteobacteria bacterium]